ncbi:MAG TPA: amino acid ABC transporter substrate-binding protein, partial [Bacteroidia bacterium]|nr:amino acid ABC transporter substrate-binding protein [Bacteroidia bacterium]
MKNILKIISLLFLIIGCSDKESNIIKIGLIEPLTGDLAMYGKPISEGALVAIAEANKKSTKYKFKLVIEDTKSETKQAITAVKKLINFDNISFIVGPGISSQMLAIAPIVEKNEVLTIGTTCENSKISQAGSYIFRVYPSYLLHGKTLAEYTINDLKLKKAAIILINNDFGIDISKEFKKEFESKGGLVVAEESYTDNTTDFRLILTKLKEKNPDIIFMSSYIAEYPRILKQAKEIGLNSRFLASSSFYDEKILKLSGSTAEGVIASTSLYDIE